MSQFNGNKTAIKDILSGTKFTVVSADKKGRKVESIFKSIREAIKSIPLVDGKIENPWHWEIFQKDDFRKNFRPINPQVVYELMQEMNLLTDEFVSEWSE